MGGTGRLAVAVLLAFALSGRAGAADKRNCDGIAFDEDPANVALGAVMGAKVNFVANPAERPTCPSAGAACRRRAFLLGTDRVAFVAGGATGDYICAVFIDARGEETHGWLPAGRVGPVPVAPRWIGTWTRGRTATITIKPRSDTTATASGEASYGQGAATSTGGFDAVIDPRVAMQAFALSGDKQVSFEKAGQYDCAVRMRQLGPYLFVRDNLQCGGVNVSFSGLYRRR